MNRDNGERCPECGAGAETMVNLKRNNEFKPAFMPGAQQCFYCGWDERVVTVTSGQATLNLTAERHR